MIETVLAETVAAIKGGSVLQTNWNDEAVRGRHQQVKMALL